MLYLANKRFNKKTITKDTRIEFVKWSFVSLGALIILKLFFLQVVNGAIYDALASDQHEIYKTLFPSRGEILLHDRSSLMGEENVYPAAINREYKTVYAQPRFIANKKLVADSLSSILEIDRDEIMKKIDKPNDPYEVIAKKVGDELVKKIEALNLEGVKFQNELYRYYPEKNIGANVLGFVSNNESRIGQYGIEGYFEEQLKGRQGELKSEKDLSGHWISSIDRNYTPAVDGDDIVLTLDKAVQYYACKVLHDNGELYQADSGALVVMDPFTGKIIAMCSYPDFDPNEYNKVESVKVYNNSTIFEPYEIGSIFKPITMAGALDLGLITPDTTYIDNGEVKVDRFTIRNHDKKAHGTVSMIEVLNQSLNTGTIFVIDKLGKSNFKRYVENFGFGKLTGITLDTEMAGDISALNKKSDIFHYTASFGQGITATPLQMVQAFSAIANGGSLVKPYIVDEIRSQDGVKKIEPRTVRKVIDEKTSTILGGMLAAVVERGTGQGAKVDGYTIAGKTGTAQIPDYERGGYSNRYNQSFIGYGPLDDPAFVMLVKYENPKLSTVGGTTAATFSKVASFILDYYKIPPDKNP